MRERLSAPAAFAFAGVAAANIALAIHTSPPLVVIGVYALLAIARARDGMTVWAAAFAAGLGIAAAGAPWLWNIFGPYSIPLFAICAAWFALPVALTAALDRRWGPWMAAISAPILWMGLEYIRCEAFPLKFAWLTPAHILAGDLPALLPIATLGSFGCGFLIAAVAAAAALAPWTARWRWAGIGLLVLTTAWLVPGRSTGVPGNSDGPLMVAVQREMPSEDDLLHDLAAALAAHPGAQLVQLPEYALDQPPTERLRRFAADHRIHIGVGGRDPIGAGPAWRNTAFIIGPDGGIIHRQVKSRPIPFFDDGEPAEERRCWMSPWGPIATPVCYDLSYTRVLDDAVAQGAVLILAPAMDAEHWGDLQHRQNAQMTVLRAAEYRIPIIRCASSGITQAITAIGVTTASTAIGDPGALIAARPRLEPGRPTVPLDRWPARAAAVLAAGVLLWWILAAAGRRWRMQQA